jgi:hypothetical protein
MTENETSFAFSSTSTTHTNDTSSPNPTIATEEEEEEEEKITVGIIGTAGRGDDEYLLTDKMFQCMIEEAYRIITREWKLQPKQTKLISGESSWADHVAVRLFVQNETKHDMKKFHGLDLYLPCELNNVTKQFQDKKGSTHWSANPGKYLNTLHYRFSRKLKLGTKSPLSSIHELFEAKDKGATITVKNGFHMRNDLVALHSQYLIAFTFAPKNSNIPKDGGTLYTWNKSKAKHKKHINLFLYLGDKDNHSSANIPSIQNQNIPKKKSSSSLAACGPQMNPPLSTSSDVNRTLLHSAQEPQIKKQKLS